MATVVTISQLLKLLDNPNAILYISYTELKRELPRNEAYDYTLLKLVRLVDNGLISFDIK